MYRDIIQSKREKIAEFQSSQEKISSASLNKLAFLKILTFLLKRLLKLVHTQKTYTSCPSPIFGLHCGPLPYSQSIADNSEREELSKISRIFLFKLSFPVSISFSVLEKVLPVYFHVCPIEVMIHVSGSSWVSNLLKFARATDLPQKMVLHPLAVFGGDKKVLTRCNALALSSLKYSSLYWLLSSMCIFGPHTGQITGSLFSAYSGSCGSLFLSAQYFAFI